MKTKSELFVESRKENWAALREILVKISRKGIRKLPIEDVTQFPDLYRSCCQDLAEARMLGLSPDVIEYLNGITGQAHSFLYFVKPLSRKGILSFFKYHLPGCLVNNVRYVLIALLLFWGSAVISFVAITHNPELVHRFVSQAVLEQMEGMYHDSVATGRTAAEQAHMSTYYIQHNTSIAFLCFSTGVFLGLGSIYFLLFNGIFLGCIFAYLVNQGLGMNLIEFVTAHSFLELNAIAIAGAAGIMLGVSILKSWKAYSFECIKSSRDNILLLVGASAILLFCAAMIEGNISPSAIDYRIKLGIAVLTAALSMLYFIALPLIRRRQK
ncbi:MAG: stage II sporulation protein M [Spirochaetales bacterium]|nr:stage II sporulation protein M [Spirochaetales bacterium]